jgi:hypothetical protein
MMPVNRSLSSTHLAILFGLTRTSSRQTGEVLMDFCNTKHLPDTTAGCVSTRHISVPTLYENEMLPVIFLPARGTRWRKQHNEEFNKLYSPQNIIPDDGGSTHL